MSSPKIAVVTGANSGLGFQCSVSLAAEGYTVVMACRNLDKAAAAQQKLLAAAPGSDLRLMALDVSDLRSVATFAEAFRATLGTLDLLINNAGIVAIPLARNAAGHEMQLATNYLGAFALTGQLLPAFKPDRRGRIVNVGSLAHRIGKLDLDDLNWERAGRYTEFGGYGRSKLAMMSFTLELDRRLRASGSPVLALGAHPGIAATEVTQNSPRLQHTSSFGRWYQAKMMNLIPSAAEAARPILLAARDPGVHGGDYYGPGGIFELGGKPARAKVKAIARDPAIAARLWALTEQMTGVRYLS